MSIPRKLAFSALAAVLAFAGLQSPAQAQTTHVVLNGPLSAPVFDPQDIVIQEGDTVRWEWGFAEHDVVSLDGAFSSGPPTLAPFTYEVTFDAAFLAANPVPGNLYNYECTIHGPFGQIGSVRVDVPTPLTLSVSNLVAGQTATFNIAGGSPNRIISSAYSLVGMGPTSLSTGLCGIVSVDLSLPIKKLPKVRADQLGNASFDVDIPAGTTGRAIWFQAIDNFDCRVSNSLAEVIG